MSTTNIANVLESLIDPLQQLFIMFISFYFQVGILKMVFGLFQSLIESFRLPG